MFSKTYGSITSGLDGILVNVSCNVTDKEPSFDINGFDDTSMWDAKTRIRGAIKSCGIKIPPQNIQVDFIPQRIAGDVSRLDLAICIAVLTGLGEISPINIVNSLFAAALTDTGELAGIEGMYSIARNAKSKGVTKLFIAPENVSEAMMVDGIDIYSINHLRELIGYYDGRITLEPVERENVEKESEDVKYKDFADFNGFVLVKRACEIAAAGGHNILINGTQQYDKAMFAERLNSILPLMTAEEKDEVTKAYSLGGMLTEKVVPGERPYRRPKQTATISELIGTYNSSIPGELVLSNNGTMFLDDLHEFDEKTLNRLITPVLDGKIGVQAGLSGIFSTNVMLIGGVQPCPCGNYGEGSCTCKSNELEKYMREMPVDFISCFDVYVKISNENLQEKTEPSEVIRKRVTTAREIQKRRLSRFGLRCNSQMNHFLVEKFCTMTKDAVTIFEKSCSWAKRSNDIYDRMLRTARTVADLSGEQDIDALHLVEAIQFYNSF